jgi:hypothetical protein
MPGKNKTVQWNIIIIVGLGIREKDALPQLCVDNIWMVL